MNLFASDHRLGAMGVGTVFAHGRNLCVLLAHQDCGKLCTVRLLASVPAGERFFHTDGASTGMVLSSDTVGSVVAIDMGADQYTKRVKSLDQSYDRRCVLCKTGCVHKSNKHGICAACWQPSWHYPRSVNVEMDAHALALGLGHWKCVDPGGNSRWRRVDGSECEYTDARLSYPEMLIAYDAEYPLGREATH